MGSCLWTRVKKLPIVHILNYRGITPQKQLPLTFHLYWI